MSLQQQGLKGQDVKRRGVLKTLVAASAAPFVLTAASKKSYRWRLVMAIPKTLPIWGPAVVAFAKKLKVMSSGYLDIRVYGAGELVPALESFAAVASGKVQMAHTASYYWQGKMPAAAYFCTVPFGMNANGNRAWIKEGGGQALWDELYAPHGVFALPAGNTGFQMGGWFNKKISQPSDFKGLKIRMPGLGGQTVERLGAKPVLVAGGEIYTNLSTGVIDATEWVGPYHDYVMGFHKIAKYYYYPAWHEPGPVLELIINRKSFEQLPSELQLMIRTAASEMDRDIYAEWLAKDAEYLEKILKLKNVSVVPFPESVLKELARHAQVVKQQIAATSDLAARITRSYEKFQKSYLNHQKITEWAGLQLYQF